MTHREKLAEDVGEQGVDSDSEHDFPDDQGSDEQGSEPSSSKARERTQSQRSSSATKYLRRLRRLKRRIHVHDVLCSYFGTNTSPSGMLRGRDFLDDSFVQTIVAASDGFGNKQPSHGCHDCSSTSRGWVSLTYGVFLCEDCARVHHVADYSYVKSLKLDTWSPRDVAAVMLGGNANFENGLRHWHKYRTLHQVQTTDGSDLASKYAGKFAKKYRMLLTEASKMVCNHSTISTLREQSDIETTGRWIAQKDVPRPQSQRCLLPL